MRSAKSLPQGGVLPIAIPVAASEAPEARPEAKAGLKLQRNEFSRRVGPIGINLAYILASRRVNLG